MPGVVARAIEEPKNSEALRRTRPKKRQMAKSGNIGGAYIYFITSSTGCLSLAESYFETNSRPFFFETIFR